MNKIIAYIALSALFIGCTITGASIKPPIEEYGMPPEIYFCPRQNCSERIVNLIRSANSSVHCAFYDLNLKEIIAGLNEQSRRIDVGLVTDGDNALNLSFETNDATRPAFMHNKFCIIDGKTVFTGSFNPTFNDNYRNNNNIVIIYSKTVAQNYEDEYGELRNNIFGRGAPTSNPIVYFNGRIIKNYFCPEDWCTNKILEELAKANHSIYFMTFSFTSEPIGDLLIKKFSEGVSVKGIFEKQQITHSQYQRLQEQGLGAILDRNPYKMHHKVFIIDNETVITGSFNPTQNAETKNDENILIITDPYIAEKYAEEFNLLYR